VERSFFSEILGSNSLGAHLEKIQSEIYSKIYSDEGIPIEFHALDGLTPYREVLALQHALVEKRVRDEIPDTVLLVEHEPVFTRGRGLQWTGIARPTSMPLLGAIPEGTDVVEVERGGDWTYHGPGQLTLYPIVKLGGNTSVFPKDLGKYLRFLETWVVRVLDRYGIEAGAKPGATGVWLSEPELKIASVGIAVKRWVTYHGIGLNVVNPLESYRLISPCGFSAEVMTRLVNHRAELTDEARAQFVKEWRTELEHAFQDELLSAVSDVV
jgi:lipoyl(octanoyl) transferase